MPEPRRVSTPIAQRGGARPTPLRCAPRMARRLRVSCAICRPVLEIPTRGAIDAVVRVPGSKSITNRALLIAALASGESQLSGGLESDDTLAMIEGLTALGCEITLGARALAGAGPARKAAALGRRRSTRASSGTTARFLTAAAALANGTVVIDGSPRMRERPIADLTDALRTTRRARRRARRAGLPAGARARRRAAGRARRDRRAALEPVRLGGAARGALRARRRGARVRGRRPRLQALRRPHARGDARLRRRGGLDRAGWRCA